MKVGLDITTAGLVDGDRGGVYRYIVKLLENLKKIDEKIHYILFFNFMNPRHIDTCNEFFEYIRGSNFSKVVSLFPPPIRMNLRLPIEWFTGTIDILHSPVHWNSPVKKAKSIVTLHDMSFLKRERLESQWVNSSELGHGSVKKNMTMLKKRKYFFKSFEKYVDYTVKNSDRIIVVSQATKNDVIDIYPEAEDKIRVIYEGVSRDFKPVTDPELLRALKVKYGIDSSYVLYLGNLDPNKNLIRLLEAFAILKHDAKVPQQLVIVGRKTWFIEILIDKIRKLGLEGQVIFTGYIPEDELCRFYSGADIFVMPSYLEGFGLPVLEAMACGVPVAAANGGSLPEIVGGAGLLMDPFEAQSIATTIHTLVNQPSLRQTLREKGFQRSRDFSWEKMALEILALYKEVYSENGRAAG